MTVDRILTFSAGFFAAVVVLAIGDALDQNAPRGSAALTFRQGFLAIVAAALLFMLLMWLRKSLVQ